MSTMLQRVQRQQDAPKRIGLIHMSTNPAVADRHTLTRLNAIAQKLFAASGGFSNADGSAHPFHRPNLNAESIDPRFLEAMVERLMTDIMDAADMSIAIAAAPSVRTETERLAKEYDEDAKNRLDGREAKLIEKEEAADQRESELNAFYSDLTNREELINERDDALRSRVENQDQPPPLPASSGGRPHNRVAASLPVIDDDTVISAEDREIGRQIAAGNPDGLRRMRDKMMPRPSRPRAALQPR